MRLLLFSDLHANRRAAEELVKRAAHVDLMIGAGDFGNLRRNVDTCINVLKQCDRPAVLTAGNNESPDELRQACADWPQAHVLHGESVEIDGICFFGLGGGVPLTPFGSWSFDLTEDQAETLLSDCPRRSVLVSHSPPQGAVDEDSGGRSLGSVVVRDAIDRLQLKLVVCGHIHASAGRQMTIGQTPVINAGPHGVEWEVH